MRFRNRIEAGQRLAEQLGAMSLDNPLVLGLPRGGIPVAWVVARQLGAGLDVFVAHKIGAPDHQEFGIGAVAEGSDDIVLTDAVEQLGITPQQLDDLTARARSDIDRRVAAYRGGRPLSTVAGHDVLVVDDGLATGVTAEVSLRALRQQRPNRLILAGPVGAREAVDRLGEIADLVVCVLTPEAFYAVGEWYDDFRQTTDADVQRMLPTPG